MRNYKIGCFAILVFTSVLHAEQRKYIVGTAVDLVGGWGGLPNAGTLASQAFQQPGSFSYEGYPAIELRSTSEHSTLKALYAFGFSRTHADMSFNSISHVVSTNFSASLGPKWKFRFSDFYAMTSDFNTFSATRGGVSAPEDSRFPVYPTGGAQSSHINSAQMQTDYLLNEKSTLSIGASHILQDYPDTSLFQGSFSDQQRTSGSLTYARRTSEHTTWSVGYSAAYLTFTQLESARVQAWSVGYSRGIRPGLTLKLAGGPSHVVTPASDRSYAAYNASAGLQKTINRDTFSLYYAQDSGDASGLAAIADTRRIGFTMDRHIGINAELFVDVSEFDAKGKIDSPYRIRGLSAAANMGLRLTKMLSLHWGGQYQRYNQQPSLQSSEQKRLFASLRIAAPELLKFSK